MYYLFIIRVRTMWVCERQQGHYFLYDHQNPAPYFGKLVIPMWPTVTLEAKSLLKKHEPSLCRTHQVHIHDKTRISDCLHANCKDLLELSILHLYN